MERRECPNCMRPKATDEDGETLFDISPSDPLPDGWSDHDGNNLCWAAIYDDEAEVCAEAKFARLTAEIRDLRAGFAAGWAEVERLDEGVRRIWTHFASPTRPGQSPDFAAMDVACFMLDRQADRAAADVARLTRERDEAQAAGAAMREALTAMNDARDRAIARGYNEATALHLEFYDRMVRKSPPIASDAGRALLERLEKAEARVAEMSRLIAGPDGANDPLRLLRKPCADMGHDEAGPLHLHGTFMTKCLWPDDTAELRARVVAAERERDAAEESARMYAERRIAADARAGKAEAEMQAVRAERDAALAMVPPFAASEARANNAEAELQRERARADEAVAALEEMVGQHCVNNDGDLYSFCLSANAAALRALAELGRAVMIEDGPGRHVTAQWKKDPTNEPG